MSSIEQLRTRIAEVGRTGAILEEMIRLGFIDANDLRSTKLSEKDIKKTLAELTPILSELNQLEAYKYNLGNIQGLILDIRRERIEQVKAKREERKIEKARQREMRHQNWEETKRTKLPYLGAGVSSRLIFEGGDIAELQKQSLPILNNAEDVASAMAISTQDLIWLCYERGVADVDHYSRFEIPKRSGGKRIISSPKPKMRNAQTWINENILKKLPPSVHAYAFRPQISILDNAKKHLDKNVIVKMDLKDFFPSITFKRVRGYFEFLGYNPGVSTILALLCTDAPRVRVTYKGESQIVAMGPRSLPQGACTSPGLANLIASRLDNRLHNLVKTRTDSWTYTRYADDLTFSSSHADAQIGTLIGAVTNICMDEKFYVNSKKTRVMRAPHRQSVTGLVVGDRVRLPKSTIKTMRALFHNIDVKGHENVSIELGKNALNVAQGYWAYMFMVQPGLALKYRKKYPWLARHSDR